MFCLLNLVLESNISRESRGWFYTQVRLGLLYCITSTGGSVFLPTALRWPSVDQVTWIDVHLINAVAIWGALTCGYVFNTRTAENLNDLERRRGSKWPILVFICFAVLCALVKQRKVEFIICDNYIVYFNQNFWQEKLFCEEFQEDCCCHCLALELQLWQ